LKIHKIIIIIADNNFEIMKKERKIIMTTLTFVFNKEKIRKAGYTEDELLQPMREHAKKYEIRETEKGVFSKEGEDAMCVISMFVPQIIKKIPCYMDYLAKWTLNVDGENEDCIKETKEWFESHNPQTAMG